MTAIVTTVGREVWESPEVIDTDWLLHAGRALMRWWNDQGASLPQPGQRFAGWWHEAHLELEGRVLGPGVTRGEEIAELLQQYAAEAMRWWSTGRSKTVPPPEIRVGPGLVESAAEGISRFSGLFWAAAVLGGMYLASKVLDARK